MIMQQFCRGIAKKTKSVNCYSYYGMPSCPNSVKMSNITGILYVASSSQWVTGPQDYADPTSAYMCKKQVTAQSGTYNGESYTYVYNYQTGGGYNCRKTNCPYRSTITTYDITVRLTGKKNVQNLTKMCYKNSSQVLVTQGDFGHEFS